jgi:hypothetical protein
VRYRRYYPQENKDGSVTVTSYGPITAPLKRLSMKQAFVTWFVLFCAFCLLSPFHAHPGSGWAVLWAMSWSIGLTVLTSVKLKKSDRAAYRQAKADALAGPHAVTYKDGKRVH